MRNLEIAATRSGKRLPSPAMGAIGSQVLVAQSTPVTRTMPQHKDLEGAEGRELLMYRADFVPGGVLGRHFHPGPELIYVLEGALVLEQKGHPL
jgi:quercetin dioxygenase-like cupin family protein